MEAEFGQHDARSVDEDAVSRPARAGQMRIPSHAPCPPKGNYEVWKFGGSSISSLARLRSVVRSVIAGHRAGKRIICVLSAMGDTTDILDRLARRASPRPARRELDALLALGENAACALAAMMAEREGYAGRSLSGPQAGVWTDDDHGGALLRNVDPSPILRVLDQGQIPFVSGFQGTNAQGDVTTLGRGGSDASAVALAVGLETSVAHIFTDVDGVLTADPRVVREARRLDQLAFDQMVELAHAGARVLQPRAVSLAKAHGITLYVRRAQDPDSTGTRVGVVVDDALESSGVVAVPHRPAYRSWRVRSLTPRDVVIALAELGAEPQFVTSMSDGSVSFRAGDVRGAELTSALGTEAHEELASAEVSVVGPRAAAAPGFAARALEVLSREAIVPTAVVQHGPSRFACHVRSQQLKRAVNTLHTTFITERTYD